MTLYSHEAPLRKTSDLAQFILPNDLEQVAEARIESCHQPRAEIPVI